MLSLYTALLSEPGDKSEFSGLYVRYKNMMYNTAYKILHDEGLAEDATHNAFLKVIKYFDKVRGDSDKKVRNLLYIIARNEAIRIYNAKKEIPDSEYIEENICDVSVRIDHENFERTVFNAVKSIDKKYADVLMLKFFYQYTDADIAELLDITVENVKIRVHRGKEKLKALLEKDGEFYE